jgi:glycosyltransferase involved in cell wall biosynthesis
MTMTQKIAYLCGSSSWGGLEMNQLRNAVWMRELGHQVVLLCKDGTPFHQQCQQAQLPMELIKGHKKYYDFNAGKELAAILSREKVTHLIIRDTRDMSVAVIAKRKSDHPVHLSYFMEMQLGVKKTNPFHTLRFSYLDLWSCPLNWLAKQVETMTHFKKDRIAVIPSGLDLSQFDKPKSKYEAREQLDLPAEKKIVGLIGRFDPYKGQVLLLQALAKITDQDVCVCLLGEPTKEAGPEYVNKMNDTIRQNGLEERVFIRPFRKDISTFFNAMDVFVMASKAETFGMVTIESMACGTPVIASNAGGSPEILDFGKYGLLFKPLDADSLAKKVEYFFSHPGQFDTEALREEASKYDHHIVCEMVEAKLGLIAN